MSRGTFEKNISRYISRITVYGCVLVFILKVLEISNVTFFMKVLKETLKMYLEEPLEEFVVQN